MMPVAVIFKPKEKSTDVLYGLCMPLICSLNSLMRLEIANTSIGHRTLFLMDSILLERQECQSFLFHITCFAVAELDYLVAIHFCRGLEWSVAMTYN